MQTTTNKSLKQGCIFCEIANHQAPCYKIWEDQKYLAFLSIFPNTDGFTVVIPKYHLSSYIFDHPAYEMHGLMDAAAQVANRMVEKLPTVARTAVVLEGYGIDHLHVKLIPLHGTKGKSWESISKIKSPITTKFAEYPGYISSHDAEREADIKLQEIENLFKDLSNTTL